MGRRSNSHALIRCRTALPRSPACALGIAQKQAPAAGVALMLRQGLRARSSSLLAVSRWTKTSSVEDRGCEMTASPGEATVGNVGLSRTRRGACLRIGTALLARTRRASKFGPLLLSPRRRRPDRGVGPASMAETHRRPATMTRFCSVAVLAASRRLLLLSSPWSKQKLEGWALATSRHPELRGSGSELMIDRLLTSRAVCVQLTGRARYAHPDPQRLPGGPGLARRKCV